MGIKQKRANKKESENEIENNYEVINEFMSQKLTGKCEWSKYIGANEFTNHSTTGHQ